MEKRNTTEVVAALIWKDGRFLICQRPEKKARALLWEFAGGKVEPGETREQALVRECREELGVALWVGEIFMEVTHAYPDMTVHLTLFDAKIEKGEPQRREHADLRWITAEEIPEYSFCPADVEILERLKKRKRYNKLVRDKIPEIIEEKGQRCVTRILTDEEYLAMLDQKLSEELAEYRESGDREDASREELADLLEVIRATVKARGWTMEEVERVRKEKAARRGGFEKKILLVEADRE